MRRLRLRSTDDERALNAVLTDFFERSDDGWRHGRIDEEITAYHQMIDTASRAGKASAEARRIKAKQRPLNDRSTNHKPITNNQDKNKRGSRLAQDLFFPKEWCDFLVEQRPELNAQKTFDQFKDYWIAQAGQKGVKLDWFATWRNWVRSTNAPKQNPADIVRLTVPSKNEPDPALEKIKADALKAAPIPLEVLAKMAELRRKA